MPKRVKQPSRDPNRAAKSVLDQVIRETEAPDFNAQLSDYMKKLGAKGGKVGGKRRMETMTPGQRSAIASKAARAMWAKRKRTKAR